MPLSTQDQIELIKLRLTNIEKIIAIKNPGFEGTLELEDEINACDNLVKKDEAKLEAKTYRDKLK